MLLSQQTFFVCVCVCVCVFDGGGLLFINVGGRGLNCFKLI